MSATKKHAKSTVGLAENRRRSTRHRLDIPASLVAEHDHGAVTNVQITEMSVAGFGLRVVESLPIGHTFHLRAFDTLIPPNTRIRIVTTRQLETGGYEAGAEVV